MSAVRYLTTAQLAERWGIAKQTLRRWRQTGKGPPVFKPGGSNSQALYKLSDVEAFEKQNTATPDNGG